MNREQADLTWLHLSDLHCIDRQTGWDAGAVRNSMLEHLKSLIKKANGCLCPDVIFFTGDLAFGHTSKSGGNIDEQFDSGYEFLEQVRKSFNPEVSKDRVFLIPGNHDVNRVKIDRSDTHWLKTASDADIHELLNGSDDRWKKQCCRTFERLENYGQFLRRKGYEHLLQDPEHLIYAHRFKINDVEFGVAGLNSAWSCSGEESQGFVRAGSDWQIKTLSQKLVGCDLAIALIHHPDAWFGAEEYNRLASPAQTPTFRVWLHGHEHILDAHHQGPRIVVSGAASYEMNSPCGYSFGRLMLRRSAAEFWLLKFEKDGRWNEDVREYKRIPWLKRKVDRDAKNVDLTQRLRALGQSVDMKTDRAGAEELLKDSDRLIKERRFVEGIEKTDGAALKDEGTRIVAEEALRRARVLAGGGSNRFEEAAELFAEAITLSPEKKFREDVTMELRTVAEQYRAQLTQLGPSERLKFALASPTPQELAKYLVALANGKGGCILLGLGLDGKPLGEAFDASFAKTFDIARLKFCSPEVSARCVPIVSPDWRLILVRSASTTRHYLILTDGERQAFVPDNANGVRVFA